MSAHKLILLASAHSYRVDLFKQAAARLGVDCLVGEDVPPPMLSKANTKLALDYSDVDRSARRIERYASTHQVGAILGLDDSGTLIAAEASKRLGLAYNDPEAARAARDKHEMRKRFAKAGVPSPAFHLYHFSDDTVTIAEQTRYPCVIKPTTLAGSRGVMRADNPEEFAARLTRLKRILKTHHCDEFLVEDYIPGEEVALEGLLDGGKLHVLALFDKPDPLEGPFFEETIYVTPSRLPWETQHEIFKISARAAAALGLRQGPVHAELRINEEGAWMVEIAARSIGGMCSKAVQFSTDMALEDISLEELIILQAMGEKEGQSAKRDKAGLQRKGEIVQPLIPQIKTTAEMEQSHDSRTYRLYSRSRASGVMMIPIPESGILTKVEGLEEAREVALIDEIEIAARLNHPLQAIPEGNSYLGFIFAKGKRPEEVENALREAHSKLRFEISPELPLIK